MKTAWMIFRALRAFAVVLTAAGVLVWWASSLAGKQIGDGLYAVALVAIILTAYFLALYRFNGVIRSKETK